MNPGESRPGWGSASDPWSRRFTIDARMGMHIEREYCHPHRGNGNSTGGNPYTMLDLTTVKPYAFRDLLNRCKITVEAALLYAYQQYHSDDGPQSARC